MGDEVLFYSFYPLGSVCVRGEMGMTRVVRVGEKLVTEGGERERI